LSGTAKDSITLELERMASTSEVEDTLAKLRTELGKPAELGSAAPAPAIDAPKTD